MAKKETHRLPALTHIDRVKIDTEVPEMKALPKVFKSDDKLNKFD
jgi:hypothetical protein